MSREERVKVVTERAEALMRCKKDLGKQVG
jgi:hypothetical protein